MKQTIDARGLACPQPVVLTNRAIASQATQLTVIVDNPVAVENVTRFARAKGFSVRKHETTEGTMLDLHREGEPAEPEDETTISCSPARKEAGPLVIFVPSNCLGRGSEELGERLMSAFFHTLLETAPRPETVIFMNAGVKLTVEGSRAVDDLRELEKQGAAILACGTCLDYYGITSKLAVGRVSNMYDIATLLLQAGRVVQL